MDDQSLSSKAAKRKRQRLRKKEKGKESAEKCEEVEQHVKSEENKQEEVTASSGETVDMNKDQEKTREQVLTERQAKKAGKKVKETPAAASQPTTVAPAAQQNPPVAAPAQVATEKAREQIMAERQAKKAGKKGKETPAAAVATGSDQPKPVELPAAVTAPPAKVEKSREQILAEREAKKHAKSAGKKADDKLAKSAETEIVQKLENLEIKSDQPKAQAEKKELTKAERRAIQEAQRAAKAKAMEDKKVAAAPQKPQKSHDAPKKPPAQAPAVKQQQQSAHHTKTTSIPASHKVKLFKHLYLDKPDLNMKVNSDLHPAIVQLGFQYATGTIIGSNARCYAFLQAITQLIRDYVTPAEKIFSRGLEAELQPAMEYLHKCRPFAVSMTNALKYLKLIILQEDSGDSDNEKKDRLIEKIKTYAHEQIETAAISISLKLREKIVNGDIILTFGCSSLIRRSLVEAWKESELKFRVIVVDSGPDFEGQQMLESLTMQGINCTYVMINSLSFIMPEVTKVILGAHALLANGTVMSRVGTAQVCLIANAFNVPVMVCCETHKFSERVQTDSFVYNEIGDPNALIVNKNTGKTSEYLKDWESNNHLTPLNLKYDVTPAELITAVVTEIAILPSTSVQVILRVKPSE